MALERGPIQAVASVCQSNFYTTGRLHLQNWRPSGFRSKSSLIVSRLSIPKFEASLNATGLTLWPSCRLKMTTMGKIDANDEKPWTEMDIRDLMAALRSGDTIEDAAQHLCRSGTVDDVRRKAEELGLKYKMKAHSGR